MRPSIWFVVFLASTDDISHTLRAGYRTATARCQTINIIIVNVRKNSFVSYTFSAGHATCWIGWIDLYAASNNESSDFKTARPEDKALFCNRPKQRTFLIRTEICGLTACKFWNLIATKTLTTPWIGTDLTPKAFRHRKRIMIILECAQAPRYRFRFLQLQRESQRYKLDILGLSF